MEASVPDKRHIFSHSLFFPPVSEGRKARSEVEYLTVGRKKKKGDGGGKRQEASNIKK